ncbi:hypothetical protein GUJ93_ZPchr0013g34414 [Zizania palustris]|uniref:Uncharacterized protein n=1 Tax=Zizania palustris TaxID=103762 RepID=A0A8J5X3K1_ZIZPA|nr:hypothetical protein GUJ93_ZPchr0013g34414 [Zizania palustris]
MQQCSTTKSAAAFARTPCQLRTLPVKHTHTLAPVLPSSCPPFICRWRGGGGRPLLLLLHLPRGAPWLLRLCARAAAAIRGGSNRSGRRRRSEMAVAGEAHGGGAETTTALSSFSSACRVGLHGFYGSAPGRWQRRRSGAVGIPGRERSEWERTSEVAVAGKARGGGGKAWRRRRPGSAEVATGKSRSGDGK